MDKPILFARRSARTLVHLALSSVLIALTSSAQTSFRVISYMHQLGPAVGLIEGSPGLFYSTGGETNQDIFSITPEGATTTLATFPTGYNLESLLFDAANRRFYSSVQLSVNPPSVFSVSPVPGSKQVYATQQFAPSLTANTPDGTFLAVGVGLADGLHYLLTTDASGVVRPIHQFPSGARLPQTAFSASDGNIYGLYYLHDGSGSVYRLTSDGVFAKVVTFPLNSFLTSNFVPLLQSADGNLYGATTTGGANGTGTIYRLTLTGEHTTIYEFPKGAVANPTELIEGSDGNLYGATLGTYSALFRVTKSGQFTLLHAMNAYLDGQCQCHLTQGSDGIIYGTTTLGGPPGLGDVFALDAGLPKPAPWPRVFEPQSGPAGTRVRIWGANLLSAAVQFNGAAAASVTNSGSSYVWATVPEGAATGPVTVTTPGGTYSTQTVFTVQ